MEKHSDTRKDIVSRECSNCGYTPSSQKYNLSIGVGISSEDKFIRVYFRGMGSYVEPKNPIVYK